MKIVTVILLFIAIVSAVRFPRAKGNAHFFLFLVMLVSTAGFMLTFVHLPTL
jgi:hypothetical protein